MADLEYKSISVLRGNFKSVHKCETCSYFSKSIFFMLNHVRLHRLSLNVFDCYESTLEQYHCHKCNLKFDAIVQLKKHLKAEHFIEIKQEICPPNFESKNYFCTSCTFYTSSSLHWLKHVLNGCLEYKTCTTRSKNMFERKIIKYEVDKDNKWLECEKCPYKTIRKGNIKRHYFEKHTDDENKKWFKCEKCSFRTLRKGDFNKHSIVKHSSVKLDKGKRFSHCEKCSYKSVSKYNIKRHYFSKHTDDKEKESFVCEKCGYKTACRETLLRHSCVKLKCNHCGYETRWEHDLAQHKMAKHTEEKDKKWFKCGMCPYKSTKKSHFVRHERARHRTIDNKKTKKRFKCDQCGFETVWKNCLQNHVLVKHRQ